MVDSLAFAFERLYLAPGRSERSNLRFGLSITKQFAKLSGGSIRVQSEMEKGSTFTVRVPMVFIEGVSLRSLSIQGWESSP
jgi:signal transduction histidine kinase